MSERTIERTNGHAPRGTVPSEQVDMLARALSGALDLIDQLEERVAALEERGT